MTSGPPDSPRSSTLESDTESDTGSDTGSHAASEPRRASAEEKRRMFRWIMWTVFGWGCLLSLGAALHGVDPETGAVTWSPKPLRGLVVFACVSGLLLGWNLLLRQQKRRS